jgi:two-component system response regulator GlrR
VSDPPVTIALLHSTRAFLDAVRAPLQQRQIVVREANTLDELIALYADGTHYAGIVVESATEQQEVALRARLGPVLVFAMGDLNMNDALRTLREGATFFTRSSDELIAEIERLAQHRAPEPTRVVWDKAEREVLGDIVGRSKTMNEVLGRIRQVAKTPATTTLIVGETGTGKELIARAVHLLSARKDKPFIAVDCGAIPPTLFESELFGHERGAFTGADTRKLGRLVIANGGTVFLDEIAELPLPAQAKLLRVLQEREVWPVGATRPTPIDIRLVSATHRDLRARVESGEFRSDLFFRLSVFEVRLPPLRERGADVLHLANHFLDSFNESMRRRVTGLAASARAFLVSYAFPGNVRELRNMMESALISTEDGSAIEAASLRAGHSMATLLGNEPSADAAEFQVTASFGPNCFENVVNELVRLALDHADGNRSHAAKLLDIERPRLLRLLGRTGVQPPALRGRPRKRRGLEPS